MDDSKTRAAELLRGPGGDEIYLRLVDYARLLAVRRGWRDGRVLPEGWEPRELAQEVVKKLLTGDRTWDEVKEPSLLNALKGMVRSELGHLSASVNNRRTEPIGTSRPDGSERTADDFESDCSDPEEMFLRKEQTGLEMVALDLIRNEVSGNGDLELVFLALYDAEDSDDIARETGLQVGRVYSLNRELRRVARKITPARVAAEARKRRKS